MPTVREENAVRRELIDVRRAILHRAITSEIAITEIIAKDDDEVGQRVRGSSLQTHEWRQKTNQYECRVHEQFHLVSSL